MRARGVERGTRAPNVAQAREPPTAWSGSLFLIQSELVGAGARSRRVVGESDVSDSGLAPVCAEVDLSGDCPVEFEGRIFSFFFHVTGDTNYRPRLASKTKRAAGPTRQPSAPSVTGVGTLLLRFQDVRCDEHGRGRPLILRPMHSFLSLRPRVTLRMLFHRTTLTVLSECALYDVRDGRPVLMRVDPDNTARLKVENPQPKLPSLHPFDLGGEVMSNCLLDRQSLVVLWRRLLT